MFTMNNINTEQLNKLRRLGYKGSENVDEAIDWLRTSNNIIVYNRMEPFVDPRCNKITFAYKVKKCNLIHGWNQREYLGATEYEFDIYRAKRQAIDVALRYLIHDEIASRLKPGETVTLYGQEVIVKVTPDDKLSCRMCQISHLCNRDPSELHRFASERNCDGCVDLIGRMRHFEILK